MNGPEFPIEGRRKSRRKVGEAAGVFVLVGRRSAGWKRLCANRKGKDAFPESTG